MPNRVVREGILTSDRVEQLDAPAEVFYRRLMSKVDDFGLYDARPSILRSSLFPLRVDRVREADISRWIAACVKAGLLVLYQHDGKPYMQMLDTRWQTRSEAKFPMPDTSNDPQAPAAASNCAQPQTTAPVFGVGVGDVDEGVSARKRARPPPKVPLPAEFSVSDRVRTWAAKNGFGQLDEHLEAFRRKCAAHGYAYRDHDAAFMEAVREDWAKLRGKMANGAPAPGVPWHETRSGIVAKGVELGIGEWSEAEWHAGRAPQWPTYQAKVYAAAGYEPPRMSA